MKDIESPRLMYCKAALLLSLGVLASSLLILEHTSLRVAFLLAVSIWAFARAYYFVFYVIEHYIDDTYKFAGLTSFVGYLWNRRRNRNLKGQDHHARTQASQTSDDSDSIVEKPIEP